MNCEECGTPLGNGACSACASEERMYAAYARGIEVPLMWDAIEARLRADARPGPSRWIPVAAAAMLAGVAIAVVLALRAPQPPQSGTPRPVDVAAAGYRRAIARLEPRASGEAAALLPELDAAVRAAERAAASAPDDPAAVTNLVAAYDAKLQLLRTNSHD